MTTTIKSVQRTKKYKALVTIGGLTEEQALAHLGHPAAQPEDTKLAELMAAGFTEDEARQALTIAAEVNGAAPAKTAEAAPAQAPVVAKPVTSKELGDALVEEQGFKFAKGRVYVTPDIIEAAVRVRKTGKPETIASSGAGRTAAVLLFKTDNGDVALQNLIKSA